MKSLMTSWKTTVLGGLAIVCTTSALLDVLPERWRGAAQGVCMILVSLGLIAAKDGNVSHSPSPEQAKKIG